MLERLPIALLAGAFVSASTISISHSARAGIFDPILGRCGIAGEATLKVSYLSGGTPIYAEIETDGALGETRGLNFGARSSDGETLQFQTGICNRDGFRIRVYLPKPQDCGGKVFLWETRYSRVYNSEYVGLYSDQAHILNGDLISFGTDYTKTVLAAYAFATQPDLKTAGALAAAGQAWLPCVQGVAGCPLAPDLFRHWMSQNVCFGRGVTRALNAYQSQTVINKPIPPQQPVSPPGYPLPPTVLRNQWSGKCLQTMGQENANGSNVNVWDCTNTSNQAWLYSANGEIRNQWSGKCLQTMGQENANGSNVNVWDCTGTANQMWSPSGNGEFRNQWSGKCLQTMGQENTNGSNVNVWDCTGTANQMWR